MATWPLRRMEDICEVTSSKRIYATELVPAGVPFLKSKEIIEKVNGQSHSNLLYISEQRFQEVAEQSGSIESGDVLLTSRGTLGVPYVVTASDRFHFADGI
jgi:type I restriction enzyme S subunit